MATFPTLSVNPALDGFKEEPAADPTQRTEVYAGVAKTRAMFTRVPMAWDVPYSRLSLADKDALVQFQKDVKVCSDSWTWTHPVSSTQYTVRLREKMAFAPESSNQFWATLMRIEEI